MKKVYRLLLLPALLLPACNDDSGADSQTVLLLEEELEDSMQEIKLLENSLAAAESAASAKTAELEIANARAEEASTALQALKSEYAAYQSAWARRADDLGRKVESITLRDGRSFAPAMILRITDDKVYIQHQDGYEELAYSDLPDTMQEKYAVGTETTVAAVPAGTSSTPFTPAVDTPEPSPSTPAPTSSADLESDDPLKQFEAIKAMYEPEDDDSRRDLVNAEIAAKELEKERAAVAEAEAALLALNDPESEESVASLEEKARNLGVEIEELRAKTNSAKRQVNDIDGEINDLEYGGGKVSRSQADILKMKRPLLEKKEALEKGIAVSNAKIQELEAEKRAASQGAYRGSRDRYIHEATVKKGNRNIEGAEETLIRFNIEAKAAMGL